ncbi:MAG: pyridoxamine 5'-phosphate oxidase family protein [Sneathiellaceae bacterium]
MTPQDIVFTPAIRQVQEAYGSRRQMARLEAHNRWGREIDGDLATFLAARNSFYLATASAEGRPYIQHRGGLPGFLKVLDGRTLGFADYPGNRQYITAGNLSENGQAFIFLMDYANRRRVKLWGRAEVVTDDATLIARLHDPRMPARPERAIRFHLEAWDLNCPQFIPAKYDEPEVAAALQKLQDRIAELEAELAAAKAAAAPGGTG